MTTSVDVLAPVVVTDPEHHRVHRRRLVRGEQERDVGIAAGSGARRLGPG